MTVLSVRDKYDRVPAASVYYSPRPGALTGNKERLGERGRGEGSDTSHKIWLL